ncbi:hypothetical protein FQA39_LY12541 [Lamprigera yunnana]|nr:hypothetical protein FQA39_LY12541 [Lamprigera yunnana]
MSEGCEIYMDKDIYHPGDVVSGRVECTFPSECKINAIRVVFRGRAKVYWKEGRYTVYQDDKVYFQKESELLESETIFNPGIYNYTFTFALPETLPSSMEETHGNVRYKVIAIVGRTWAMDYVSRFLFTVYSMNNLNLMGHLNRPVKYEVEKTPFALFGEPPPIKVIINLARNGFFFDEFIPFSAKVVNRSAVNIEEIRFKIIQGYSFHVRKHSIQHCSYTSPEYAIIDSGVSAESEDEWGLELRVPSDIFIGSFDDCEMIKIFWKLRGEVCLPFPHTNFTIDVPLVLGDRMTEA